MYSWVLRSRSATTCCNLGSLNLPMLRSLFPFTPLCKVIVGYIAGLPGGIRV